MSMTIAIIGMHGAAFSGKDLACQILRAATHQDVVVIEARVAEAIYGMIRTLLPQAHSGMSKEDKELRREELGGLSIRQMAIAIGEGARKWSETSWVTLWETRLCNDIKLAVAVGAKKILVLVPDLRKDAERRTFYRLAATAKEISDDSFWPEGPINSASQLVMLQAENGQVNEQFNSATETQMETWAMDVEVVNDQAQGPAAYCGSLLRALAFSERMGFMFSEIFDENLKFHDIAERAMRGEAEAKAKWASAGLSGKV